MGVRRMKPEQLAKCNTEHGHQCALFCWSAIKSQDDLRYKMLFAVPNGGERHKAVAAKMKAEGLRKGVPDVFLAITNSKYPGFFIEMKKPGLENTPSAIKPDQLKWHDGLRNQGYKVEVYYNWIDASKAIEAYLQII